MSLQRNKMRSLGFQLQRNDGPLQVSITGKGSQPIELVVAKRNTNYENSISPQAYLDNTHVDKRSCEVAAHEECPTPIHTQNLHPYSCCLSQLQGQEASGKQPTTNQRRYNYKYTVWMPGVSNSKYASDLRSNKYTH